MRGKLGRKTDFSEPLLRRLRAAFRFAAERPHQAAEKNSVLPQRFRPVGRDVDPALRQGHHLMGCPQMEVWRQQQN